MTLAGVARAHYAAQESLSDRTERTARALWFELDPADLSGSWLASRIGLRLFVALSTAQLIGAAAAIAYVAAALLQQGARSAPRGTLAPRSLAGVASDGRDLEALLYEPLIRTKVAIRDGATIERALAVGESSLATIVSTQVADAGRAAESVAMVTQPAATGWVRMLVPPSCGRCAILAGRFYRFSDGFLRHPQCLPAGVVVSGPRTDAATRRWYKGELVILRTAGGKYLPTTSNHPILTDHGWVPANLIKEGDHVVGATSAQGADPLEVPHEHQVPSRIENLWRSDGMTVLHRMPSASEQFHGDGGHGEVDIVSVDGLLGSGLASALSEHGRQPSFSRGPWPPPVLTTDGGLPNDFIGDADPTDSIVSSSSLPPSLLGCHSCGPDLPGGGSTSHGDALLTEMPSDDRSADPISLSQSVLALPGFVGGNNLGDRQDQYSSRWDPPSSPFSEQNRVGYASRGQDLHLRLTGQVALDRVVHVSRISWSGHVYNLTSVEGWYNANGLIVSNCDCRHVPTVEDAADDLRTDPDAYFRSLSQEDQDKYFTKAGAESIRLGADIGQVVNARRGAQGLSQPGRLTDVEQRMLRGGRNRGRLQRVDVYGRQVLTTTEGTTRRGVAGRRLIEAGGATDLRTAEERRADRARGDTSRRPGRAKTPRLMPDSIIELAGGDRETAVRLLRRFGYITD